METQLTQKTVEEARSNLLGVSEVLNRILVGREEEVKAAMLALVAKENLVMIGPPGTGKTMLATTAAKLLGVNAYTALVTRYTTLDELVGPLDVVALKNGEVRRRWSRLVDSWIIFLDEIFKASPALLNALLSLLNERVVYDPFTGTAVPTKLWTAMAASNETPQDDELQALYDRFAVRVFVKPIADDLVVKALETRWLNGVERVEQVASPEDVVMLHEYAMSLAPDALKLYRKYVLPLVQLARGRGIFVSDRTVIEKLFKLFLAYLALRGTVDETTASMAAVELIGYVARTPEEQADLDNAVKDMLKEVGELKEKLEEAKHLYRLGQYKMALPKFRDVLTYDVEKLAEKPWLREYVKAIMDEAQQYVLKISDFLSKVGKR